MGSIRHPVEAATNPTEAGQAVRARSRRALLTAAAAAGGALATQALVRPAPATAADVLLGGINNTTAATTIRNYVAGQVDAKAIVGLVSHTAPGGSTAGVMGQSNARNGNGVFGVALSGGSKGVWGRTASGSGVYGQAIATSGVGHGVFGETLAPDGRGVYGHASATTGRSRGVYGLARSSQGIGVYGRATATSGNTVGVWAQSDSPSGIGLYGIAYSQTGQCQGVYGESRSTLGIGVWGRGMHAFHGSGYGVDSVGMYATGYTGVYGAGVDYGVYGFGGSKQVAYAGYFWGKVHVSHTFTATSKQFLIDHPQDPANKTLAHACVEAPEALNVYRGTVVLDARGRATVRLPRYFRALNREFGYQLTAIGAPAPALHVSRTIERTSFVIAGGVPGQQVCWIVTGARDDAWTRRHPLRVERAKPPRDRGKYLNPELFGRPRSAGIHHIRAMANPPRRPPAPAIATTGA
jgi:hypothetical protein